jgi:hypothetical protein
LQDDIAKYVSNPTPSPRLEDIPEEGKSKVKECREVGEGDDTVTIEDTSDEEDGRRSRSVFSYGPRSADLGCPISPLLMIGELSWRLFSPHRRGSRAMWHGSASPRN